MERAFCLISTLLGFSILLIVMEWLAPPNLEAVGIALACFLLYLGAALIFVSGVAFESIKRNERRGVLERAESLLNQYVIGEEIPLYKLVDWSHTESSAVYSEIVGSIEKRKYDNGWYYIRIA